MHALTLSPSHGARTPPALAHPDAAMPGEYLTFRIGDEHYAIDILGVQEIRSFEEPTRIANAPPDVRGVMDLRGVIVPIIDLRMRLGLMQVSDGASTVVIVVALGPRVVGLVVDAVSDVAELEAKDFRPAPDFSGAGSKGLVQCIALRPERDEARMLVVLKAANLFDDGALGTLPQALEPPAGEGHG